MLQEYGVEKFQHLCQQLGLTTLVYPPDHYGLSLILGGGEAELWELCGLYAGMARVLDHFNREACYLRGDLFPPRLVPADSSSAREKLPGPEVFSAAAIWQTFEALRLVNRPESETGWDFFSSTRRIAWKTGTSFGYRDAWAIGTTPGYVVGVWAGNADGEGRPGLTGISAAAPILFELFNLLPPTGWFEAPYEELYPAVVCRQSGHLAGRFCEPTDTQWVTKGGLESAPCPYHILVHLDASGRFRVTSRCESVSSMIHRNWFVLPPVQEWFYRFRNPSYQPLPPFREGCHESEATLPLGIIYPREGSRLVIPRELSGEEGKMIAEATHRDPDEKIYWHLDHVYLGMTREVHQMGMSPGPGPHTITLVDGAGNTCVVRFTVAAE